MHCIVEHIAKEKENLQLGHLYNVLAYWPGIAHACEDVSSRLMVLKK